MRNISSFEQRRGLNIGPVLRSGMTCLWPVVCVCVCVCFFVFFLKIGAAPYALYIFHHPGIILTTNTLCFQRSPRRAVENAAIP